ncbi:protein kinase [Mycolicibacterium sp. BiH015]|uniref:serine/threonine-protein kinase n=1 Tax=Mycolicibacterium sp. BiH015 TaxID=3018808 RepID=UPI0022E73451|nr:serine/threonine-protein kinase [Mycolicibacterium sp. BiH015]MDA2892579.1 protein kinase [Mycolicibacterium sp. BiH015]
MPLQNGETFAGYRVLRLLGSGGMGEVYLVQHPRLPRQEALKVLRSDLSSDDSFRERFVREADLAAGLRHSHIVGVHDRGEHQGRLWIAMDYIDGIDAAHLLEKKYPAGMPVDLVVRIAADVASALDYAHKRGLLHRDVKPANIIVADLDGEEPNVYLADFGIARPLDDTSGITTTNMTVGTVAYAAPEQLMGEQMDGRADQYALAATVYNLLSGAQLFPHSNPAVVISRHLNTTPPNLCDCRPDCAGLNDVLQIALAKTRENRFPSCSAFAQALADESSGQGGASANATTQAAGQPRSSVSTMMPRPRKPPATKAARPPKPTATKAARPIAPRAGSPKKRAKILLPLILVVLLLGAAAFSTTQLLRPPPQPSTAAPDWQPYVDYGRQFAVTLMSLDYTKADEDVQRILDGATGSFRDDFDKQRADFVKAAVDSKVVTTATVNSAGLESVGDGTASVLVAATSQVSNANGAKEDPRSWRLVMTVMRIGGDYKVSKVEFAS